MANIDPDDPVWRERCLARIDRLFDLLCKKYDLPAEEGVVSDEMLDRLIRALEQEVGGG